jgi:hypothetical protein
MCVVRGRRTVAIDHALVAIVGYGLEKFIPAALIALWPQTADGNLIDHGGPVLSSTVNLLADRASQGGLAIGYLEHILLAAGSYDPLHDEWNQVLVGPSWCGRMVSAMLLFPRI